jgi:Coenzyme PQQ synthesis protein D (PqqD)
LTTYQSHPQVIFTPMDEEDGLLLHLDTKLYYSLNGTGRLLWEGLAGGLTGDDLARRLSATYEVDAPQAVAEVRRFADELLAERLLQRR